MTRAENELTAPAWPPRAGEQQKRLVAGLAARIVCRMFFARARLKAVQGRRMANPIRLALLLLVFGPALGACRSADGASGTGESLHLVVDAGSSGTRFCLYAVHSADGQCHAPPRDQDHCKHVPAPDGLADLEDRAAIDVLERGFAAIAPADRARIKSAVLLGTGGFRKKSAVEQTRKMALLENHFRAKNINLSCRVITGDMEGKLAWRTMTQTGAKPPFAVVETGGATVQYAAGNSVPNVDAVSATVGMNLSYDALQNKPDFKHCRPGQNKDLNAYTFCQKLIMEFMAGGTLPARAATITQRGMPGPVYGLGKPWAALFIMAEKNDLNLGDIDIMGTRYCGLTVEETTASGVDPKFAPRTCFLIAYQSALLRTVGRRRVVRGGESWPRGAAVSHEYFPSCK